VCNFVHSTHFVVSPLVIIVKMSSLPQLIFYMKNNKEANKDRLSGLDSVTITSIFIKYFFQIFLSKLYKIFCLPFRHNNSQEA
jgi:hypothetical protein